MRVGLTGGMASGKSTVARIWKAEGAYVLSSDETVHRLLEEDENVQKEIAHSFGERVFDDQGRILRPALAEIVFSDESARRRLIEILHPRTIARHLAEAEAYLQTHPDGIVVFDSPLLFESGLDAHMDVTVVVSASHEHQVARALARAQAEGKSLSREEVERRIARQMPLAEKCRRATYILENNGSLEDLQQKAEQLWSWLRSKRQGVPPC